MKKSSIFKPDARNIGGRKAITELMINHHNSLVNMKPSIRIEKP